MRLGTLIFLSFAGFVDAAFLTIEHYTGGILPCTTGGCETVTNSVYSTVGGVPLALFGALAYLSVFVLIILFWYEKKALFYKMFLGIEAIGFTVSLYLVYLQLFVLHAICQYCMFSALVSTLLFWCGVGFRKSLLAPAITVAPAIGE